MTCRDIRLNRHANRPASRLAHRLAMIGALAAALALAGCGRKGPPELPPSAAAAEREAAAADPSRSSGPVTDAQGRPMAPQSKEKKKIFLDWLLD